MNFEIQSLQRQGSLDASTRECVWALTGLSQLSFRFTESIEELIFRDRLCVEGSIQYLLESPPPSELPTFSAKYSAKRLIDKERELTLWGALFPRPFSTLELFFLPQPGVEVTADSDFLGKIDRIYRALRRLEERLSFTELSILYLTNADMSLPLLLHFNRHRLLGVEGGESISRWDREIRDGSFDPKSLDSLFGTSPSFAHWELPGKSRQPLEGCLESLDALLESPRRLKIGLGAEGAASGYELGL